MVNLKKLYYKMFIFHAIDAYILVECTLYSWSLMRRDTKSLLWATPAPTLTFETQSRPGKSNPQEG